MVRYVRINNIVITRKNIFKCALSFFVGGAFCFYLIIYSLLDSSVSRLNVLNTAIYEGSIKMDTSSLTQNIAAIIYDDIDFYTVYRSYYPKFMTDNLDMRFCMSFRNDPSSSITDIYFQLVNSKQIQNLITSRAKNCFD